MPRRMATRVCLLSRRMCGHRGVLDLVKWREQLDFDSAHMIDPSRRLVPSTVPEDHPIHDAAEAGELARVHAFLDRRPSLVHDINRAGGNALTARSSADRQTW